MSMPDDFITVVRAIAPVTALVDSRIHHNVLPTQIWDADSKRPSLCYFVSTDPPDRTFCGTDDLRKSHFTFHCSAVSYEVAVALAAALTAGLDGYDDVSGETAIGPVFLEADFDNPEPEPGIYTKSVQFAVWHQQE